MTRRITPTATLVLPASAPEVEWLEARRWRDPGVPYRYEAGYRIGSSDVPSILDLPHVDTPAHVYHAKVNMLEKERTEPMDWGHILEEPIAFEWCRRNRTTVRRIGLVAHVDEPWHQSTLDRRVVTCPLGIEGGCGLEIKNVGAHSYTTRWHDEVPDRILAQVVHQLLVTGFHHMHYAINVGGNRMVQGVVYRDRELKLLNFIREAVNDFRDRHLLTGVEPEWTAEGKVDKYLSLHEQLIGDRVGEVGIDGIDAVYEYVQWSTRAGEADRELKRLKLKLAQLAGGAEIVTVAGERAYSYGRGRRSNTNYERLREKYPQVYADPEIVTETSYPILRIDKTIRAKAKE